MWEYPKEIWASLVAQMVKIPPATWETWVQFLGWEYPLERAWQPTPVFLPGKSPWTEEPGGLQSMWSQRVGHDWATKHIKRKHIDIHYIKAEKRQPILVTQSKQRSS